MKYGKLEVTRTYLDYQTKWAPSFYPSLLGHVKVYTFRPHLSMCLFVSEKLRALSLVVQWSWGWFSVRRLGLECHPLPASPWASHLPSLFISPFPHLQNEMGGPEDPLTPQSMIYVFLYCSSPKEHKVCS